MMYLPDWMITGAGKLGLKLVEALLLKPKRQEEETQGLRRDPEAENAKTAEYESFENLRNQFTYSQEDGILRRKNGDGLYCQPCMDLDHREVRLVPCGNGIFQCPVHKDFTYVVKRLHRTPRSFHPGRRY
jgi:hypothetical protein